MIFPIPPGMVPAAPSDFSLQGLLSNINAYAEAYVRVTTTGTNTTISAASLLMKNVILESGASADYTLTLPATARILDALGPTIPRDGSFYFPLYIANLDTGFTATLTAGDASTTIDGDATIANDTVGKWMVRVSAATSAQGALTLVFQRTLTAVASGSGVGTVTSVGLTAPAEFSVTGSPVTTTGTLAIAKVVQNANEVWAGPTTGADAVPTFRALVAADIPVNNFGTIAVAGQSDVVADSPSDTLTLVEGSNVTITTSAGGDSVTIAASGGASTNSFETIAVSGQSNVVADSPTDTLTLVAGTNMVITTNAGADSVTLTSTAGNAFGTIAVSGQDDVVADAASDTVSFVAGSGITITTQAASDNVTFMTTSSGVSVGDSWLWGSGRDGVVHFDGVNTFSFAPISNGIYVLERSVHATNCTIDVGVTVAVMDWQTTGVGGGCQIYCTDTLTVNGHLHNDGANNTINMQIGGIGGGGVSGVNAYYGNGSDGGGGATGNGSNGTALTNSFGGTGGAGGAGDGTTGGNAGVRTPPINDESGGVEMLWTLGLAQQGAVRQATGTFDRFYGGTGGGGGGGDVGILGGGAGGGGGGFGIFAREMAGNGLISCDGADGNDGFGTNAGGGGAGGGGVLCIWTTTTSLPMTTRANGGTGGASGGGIGVNGSNGSNGVVAVVLVAML